jgi:hypothetical protein
LDYYIRRPSCQAAASAASKWAKIDAAGSAPTSNGSPLFASQQVGRIDVRGPPGSTAALLEESHVAELAARHPLGFGAAQTCGQQRFSFLFEMLPDF